MLSIATVFASVCLGASPLVAKTKCLTLGNQNHGKSADVANAVSQSGNRVRMMALKRVEFSSQKKSLLGKPPRKNAMSDYSYTLTSTEGDRGVDSYRLENWLGDGTFAAVYSARRVESPASRVESPSSPMESPGGRVELESPSKAAENLVAIKLSKGDRMSMRGEADRMRILRGKKLVPDLLFEGRYGAKGGILVMEHMAGGDLANRMKADAPISPAVCFDVYRDLLKKLNEISTLPNNVVLSDIKLENILIKNRNQPLVPSPSESNLRFGDLSSRDTYSPTYASPRVLLRLRLPVLGDSQWSLNMSVLEFFARERPIIMLVVRKWQTARSAMKVKRKTISTAEAQHLLTNIDRHYIGLLNRLSEKTPDLRAFTRIFIRLNVDVEKPSDSVPENRFSEILHILETFPNEVQDPVI